jgi:hypothetical protein
MAQNQTTTAQEQQLQPSDLYGAAVPMGCLDKSKDIAANALKTQSIIPNLREQLCKRRGNRRMSGFQPVPSFHRLSPRRACGYR